MQKGGKISLGLLGVSVAAALMACRHAELSLDDVGEGIALSLLKVLPRKKAVRFEETLSAGNETHSSSDFDVSGPASKGSAFDNDGPYCARTSMESRLRALKEACKKYSDFMRVESHMHREHFTGADNVLYNPKHEVAMCAAPMVAAGSFNTLFGHAREAGPDFDAKKSNFKATFPMSMKGVTRAVMVRHPLERLVSAYRHTFEARFNAATNSQEAAEMSFPDFVYVVLEGAIEYADFLEENDLDGQSVAIDTGSLDGRGLSRAWNPIWRHCSVCHPLFQPHLILHMDHFQEDSKVLIDLLGDSPSAQKWLGVRYEVVSGKREVEQHYWSQISKEDIRRLHDKYRLDHEMFGFSPDYYVAMGRDGYEEEGAGEQDDTEAN